MANLHTIDPVEGLIPAAMPRPEVSAAYWEGYNLAGAFRINPYYEGSSESRAWVDGWYAGQQEAAAWAAFGNAAGL